jgi:hypothetical protein
MKRFAFIIALGTFALIGLNNCGPSQKELDEQKRKEDSANMVESNSKADDADKLLRKMDSIDKAKQDSIDLASTQKKK